MSDNIAFAENWLKEKYDTNAGTFFGIDISLLSKDGLLRLINHLGCEISTERDLSALTLESYAKAVRVMGQRYYLKGE